MHYTEVSNKVAPVTVDNNELTFPQFLIISNHIVVRVTLTHFVLSVVTLEDDL